MKSAKSFLDIRERILKNSIYNSLLISALCKTYTCTPSYSIIPVNEKLKAFMKPKSKAKYLMCKIVAVINSSMFQIGYAYNDNETIWTHFPNITSKNYTSALKKLAEEIYNLYPVVPTKQDKIFSKTPVGFLNFLESNNISSSLWKSGTSRNIKPITNTASKHDINKYYKTLHFRNVQWFFFNTLLIRLIKNGSVEIERKDVGKLTITKTGFDMRLNVSVTSYTWNTVSSAIVHYEDLNPDGWEKYQNQISSFEMFNLF